MKVSQIRHIAELYCGRSIENDMAIQAVNQGLAAIGDAGLYHDTEAYATAVAHTWYDLPATTTGIITVEKLVTVGDVTTVYPYSEWQTRHLQIMFHEDGAFQAVVRLMASVDITGVFDEPDVHPLFHRPLAIYMSYFVKMLTDDTSVDGNNQLQLFYSEVERASTTLKALRKQ